MNNWTPPEKKSIDILEIVVVSPAEVIVDGIPVGRLCDAIANMPQHAHKFQTALERAWETRMAGTGDL